MKKNMKRTIPDALKITLVYGLPTGLITGILLFVFKWMSQYVLKATFSAYDFTRENPLYIPLLFLGLIGISAVVAYFVSHERNAGGGAIGRAAGLVRGLLTFKWLRTLISTFISAQMVFLSGVPFGIEGPSVLIGTSVAGGVHGVSKASSAYKSYTLTAGASAGFSIATGSVLAGTIFPLEEMHKRFSLNLLLAALSGAGFASLTMKLLSLAFNQSTELFFHFDGAFTTLPVQYIWLVPIVGILAGFMALLFNFLVEHALHLNGKYLSKVSLYIKFAVNFIIIGIFGLMLTESLGNGHHSVLLPLFSREFKLPMLLILFGVKLITILISNTSGITGGLFVPVLVVGGLFTAIINELFILMGFDPQYTASILLIGVTAFFATSMQAPITTLAFVIETTLHPEMALLLIIGILFGMITSTLFKLPPLNEITLKRLMKIEDKDRLYKRYEIRAVVKPGSFVTGKAVREVMWPSNCLIKEMVQVTSTNSTNRSSHDGDRVFELDDHIIIFYQTYDINMATNILAELFGKQTFEVILQDSPLESDELNTKLA